jgi:hypothetical protein
VRQLDHLRAVTHVCTLPALAMLWVLGCTAYRPPDPSTQLPVSEFKMVAKTWEGTVRAMPDMTRKATVVLIIQENGSYTFVGEDWTQIALGAGMFTLRDNLLRSDSNGRNLSLALYQRKEHRILAGEARSKAGEKLFVELNPRTSGPQ